MGRDSSRSSFVSALGFVLGVAVPFPLWDRRQGMIDFTEAESSRLMAQRNAVALRISQETEATRHAVQQADAQVAALSTALGEQARVALRAAETAFNEGEITLVEWLDAVRAYQEAESAFARYEALRRPRVERVAKLSRSNGFAFHVEWPFTIARDLVIAS